MGESAVKTAKKLIKKANKDEQTLSLRSLTTGTRPQKAWKAVQHSDSWVVEPGHSSLQVKSSLNLKQAFYHNGDARDLPPLKTVDTVCIQPVEQPWKKALSKDGSSLRQNRRHLKVTPESRTPTTQMPKQTELPTKQETNTSDPSSSEVAIPQEPVIKQPATQVASQTSGGNQTGSGQVTRPPSYLKDFVC